MTYKRLMKLLRGYKRFYLFAIISALLGVTFYMQRPIIIKITVDSVLDNKPLDSGRVYDWLVGLAGGLGSLRDNLWICGIGLVGTIAFYCVFIFIRDRLASLASEGMAKDLKDRLYDHIQRMPYNYHVHAKTGDLIQRCTSDVETVRRFLSAQLITIARILFTLSTALVVMFSESLKMTLVCLTVTPVIFLFSYLFHASIKKNFKISDEMEGELSTVIQESLTGVRVVRAFGRQKYELDKFTEKNTKLAKLNKKLLRLLALYWSLSDALCFSQIAFTLIFGIYMVNSGEITLGTLLLFVTYEGSIMWPLRQLGRVLSDMGKMQISLGRLFEILDAKEEEHSPDAVKPSLAGDIVFKNVSFHYDGGKNVLDGVNFEIKQGQTVAILGTTGSGKSTLMHLLLRLYDYRMGSITVNGTELNCIDKNWLRTKIGIVLQEPFLFSRTIEENLKMAKADASKEEIELATQTARAHDFILEFEKGYDTMVGERGVTLSGGQKQRVAIARTLIKDSQILIFDDSLSAVDSETDSQIRAALKERQKGVTTFIISQRITTLMSADKILVFEGGKLTDLGTHDELITRDGLYTRIWKIQNMLEEDFDIEAS